MLRLKKYIYKFQKEKREKKIQKERPKENFWKNLRNAQEKPAEFLIAPWSDRPSLTCLILLLLFASIGLVCLCSFDIGCLFIVVVGYCCCCLFVIVVVFLLLLLLFVFLLLYCCCCCLFDCYYYCLVLLLVVCLLLLFTVICDLRNPI